MSARPRSGGLRGQAELPQLGPRFGANMPDATEAIGALDPASVAAAFDRGNTLGIIVAGHEEALGRRGSLARDAAAAGYRLDGQANPAVALKLDLDEELRREGAGREVVHAVQNARKGAGPGGRGRGRADPQATTGCSRRCASTGTTSRGKTGEPPRARGRRARRSAHVETARIEGSELAIALKRAT